MRLVYLPDDVDPAVTQVSEPAGAVATTPVTGSGDAMIAYTQTLLVPLVEALQQSEARAREQAEQLGRLAERLDHVTAELGALRASHVQQDANPGPEAPAPDHGDAPVPLPARLRATAPWALTALVSAAALVLIVLWIGGTR